MSSHGGVCVHEEEDLRMRGTPAFPREVKRHLQRHLKRSPQRSWRETDDLQEKPRREQSAVKCCQEVELKKERLIRVHWILQQGGQW